MNLRIGVSMRKIWAMDVALVVAMGCFASAEAATWKPVCESHGHTLILSSEHFEICRKAKYDDGSTNNVGVYSDEAQKGLDILEDIFSFYHDSLKWSLPEPGDPDNKVKIAVYVFEDERMGALYGGDNAEGCNDAGCSPGIWLGKGSLSDRWGLAHEYAHGMQSIAGWMGNNSHTGWICESHANWMAHQYIPNEVPGCSEYLINFPYLYYGSTRDRYCNWHFMEHLKEEFGGGIKGAMEVNRIWTESIRDGEEGLMDQTPFSAMMMVYGWTLDSLNEKFGRMTMKHATLEYTAAKKTLYKKAWGDYEFKTRRSVGVGYPYSSHGRITMLDRLDSSNNRYISPSYWAPQRWGYNLVRIYPKVAGKVTVKFRGVVQDKKTVNGYKCFGDNEDDYMGKKYHWCNYAPDALPDPNSGWTVGLVAEGADGTPRYSEMKQGTGFNLEIETKDSDKALWLAVTATPTKMQTILWDQFYYSIYRYPYMIEVENGAPEGYNEGFWAPANANGYAKHANGGGLVSSKARVAATAYVGPNAVVNGGTGSGNARIEDFAVIDGGSISGNAVVRGRALVSAGTISDDAVLEEDAWLVSGTISDKAKVGALSVIYESSVKDNAQIYGVMWSLEYRTVGGTAQLRGDLENNFSQELSKGVFYGMVEDAMLNNANYGANLTTPPTEATASIENAKWYAIAEDSTAVNDKPTFAQNIEMKRTTLPTQLQVFGVNGKMLGKVKFDGDWQTSLYAAGFKNGVYIVRSLENRQTRRVVLNR